MGSYSQGVRALQDIIAPLYGALEHGLAVSSEYHADRSLLRRDDPWFYLHMVRRIAVERLRAEGIQPVKDETGAPLLALSGIMLLHRGLAVRVLHAQAAPGMAPDVPTPGRSQSKQAFWHQQPALPGLQTDNHLLLWQDEDGTLSERMEFVRPLSGDYQRSNLEVEWRGPLFKRLGMLRAADLDELQPDYQTLQLGQEDT